MAVALRELLAVFDIKVDDKELKQGHKEVEGFKGKLKEAAKFVAEAFAVHEVYEFIAGTIEAGARVADLSNRLGVGTKELQAFQFAARLNGVEAESAAHSLGFLNRVVGDAMTGNKEAAQTFAALGVKLKDARGQARPTADILNDIADAFQKLPDQQTRAAYAVKLFSREGAALLPMLKGGSQGIAKLREEFEELGGGMSDDFVKAAKEVDDEQAKVSLGFRSLRARIVGALLPAFAKGVDVMKHFVIGAIALTKKTYVLTTALRFLSVLMGVKVLRIVLALAKTFGLLKGSILQTVRALLGFAAPYAAIAALYLIFDDLFTLMRGGKSVIGSILDELYGAGTAAKFAGQLQEAWDAVTGTFGAAGDAFGELVKAMTGKDLSNLSGADVLRGIFVNLVEVIVSATRLMTGFFGMVGHGLSAIASATMADWKGMNAELEKAGKSADSAGNAVFGKNGIFGDLGIGQADSSVKGLPPEIAAAWQQRQLQQSTLQPGERYGKTVATANPNITSTPILAPQTVTLPASGVGGRHVSQHNVNHIAVHTASDQPRAVGDAVGAGVATATQKDLQNALAAAVAP